MDLLARSGRTSSPTGIRKWSLVARFVALFGLLIVTFVAAASTPASATVKPPTYWSFYVEDPLTSAGVSHMFTLGCNQARSQNAFHTNSLTVLDFGGMINGAGVQETINGILLSQGAVETLAEWFGNGYKACAPSFLNILAIGTNNSITLTEAEGAAFGRTVTNVHNWMAAFSPHETAMGANDIESWSGSEAPASSYNWYAGYASTTPYDYADYGSADGCPLNYSGHCAFGWGQGDYYNLSWREPLATPLPEVYVGGQAAQWFYISGYGAPFHGQIKPWGPLDEFDLDTRTNTPNLAWSALNRFFPAISYSMEIHKG